MIDTASEQLLTLQQAADRMPVSRGGRPVHFATIWRWIKSRKLEGVRLGDRWLTSVEALQRYAERETLAALGKLPAPELPVQTTGRKRAIERAEHEAAMIGI
jgi:excisionase family DNA binding protein